MSAHSPSSAVCSVSVVDHARDAFFSDDAESAADFPAADYDPFARDAGDTPPERTGE